MNLAKQNSYYKYILGLTLFLFVFKIYGADSLRISIKQADSIFLKNNYTLLASMLNISSQKAQIIQAKLYPNPIFTAELNAYDPDRQQVFHINESGQKSFQLEQLILLGGKRKAQINIAKTNVKIAELEFQQLISNLKFQLHTSLYSLSQQSLLINKYNKQMDLLDTILESYDKQVQKGNIAMKDAVRLKGFYLSLSNERSDLYKSYFDEMSKVQSILQTTLTVAPIIKESEYEEVIKLINIDDLNNTALQNRSDYLIIEQDKILAEQYFLYQKKMAISDVNLYTAYDQRGGAFNNQINIGINIPLPIWNRNQGAINSAKYEIKQKEYNSESFKHQLISELYNSFSFYNQAVIEYKKTNNLYNEDFELSFNGISENFRKGNVSILEFVDFFEAYNNALVEISRVKVQLRTSTEQINLTAGKEIF